MNEQNFERLHERLLNLRRMSALAYPGGGTNFLRFLPAKITRMYFSDDFAVDSLIRGTEHGNLHLLYVLPRELFNSLSFSGVKRVAKFVVTEHSVETVWSEDSSLPTKKLSYTSLPKVEVQPVILIPPPTYYIDQFIVREYRHIPSDSTKKQQKEEDQHSLVPIYNS